jgi:hypothetical protein
MSSARLNRSPSSTPAGEIKSPYLPNALPRPGSGLFKVPYVDPSLIAYLEEVFPLIVLKDRSLREYDVNVGHREVIQHLQGLYEEQLKKE